MQANKMKVKPTVVDWINRWRDHLTVGRGTHAGETIGRGPMRVMYSESKQMMPLFLEFSEAL